MFGKLAAVISALALVLLGGGGAVAQEGVRTPGDAPVAAPQGAQAALASGFTYQGRLKNAGGPVNGACDFQFGLWDASSGGAQIGTTLTRTNIGVADGYFTLELDYGAGAFQGDARWLEIYVRCPTGQGQYEPLTPRQPLTASPYALYAITAGNAWSLTGNAGTTPGTNYVGTSDNQALELKVNGARALRLEPNATSPNVIGGYSGNWVTAGVVAATVGGGGVSDNLNRVTDSWATVGGGIDNQAGDNAGDGWDHAAATVGGGYGNTASGYVSTVGGGIANDAGGGYSTVGGGYSNTATAGWSTVCGGASNRASGSYATVPGGAGNVAAGEASFAAGFLAKALHKGSFVWADSSESPFESSAADQFLVRASGGVGINTDAPTPNTLTVGGAGLRVATDGTTFKRIQAGTATLGQGGAGTGTRRFTVQFPVAFSGAPAVIATARGGNYSDTFVITTYSISGTQFGVNVYRVDIPGGGWTQTLQLDWLAWEK